MLFVLCVVLVNKTKIRKLVAFIPMLRKERIKIKGEVERRAALIVKRA